MPRKAHQQAPVNDAGGMRETVDTWKTSRRSLWIRISSTCLQRILWHVFYGSLSASVSYRSRCLFGPPSLYSEAHQQYSSPSIPSTLHPVVSLERGGGRASEQSQDTRNGIGRALKYPEGPLLPHFSPSTSWGLPYRAPFHQLCACRTSAPSVPRPPIGPYVNRASLSGGGSLGIQRDTWNDGRVLRYRRHGNGGEEGLQCHPRAAHRSDTASELASHLDASNL